MPYLNRVPAMRTESLYKNLLLIDDDADDADLLREALGAIDPGVVLGHFDNEELAMKTIFETGSASADLILLDINLDTLSGLECLRLIKKDPAAALIPVIIYTTSSQAREKEISYKLGAEGYLTKPNDFKMLRNVLGLILITPIAEMKQMLEFLPQSGTQKGRR